MLRADGGRGRDTSSATDRPPNRRAAPPPPSPPPAGQLGNGYINETCTVSRRRLTSLTRRCVLNLVYNDTPVAVAGGHRFATFDATLYHTCALNTTNSLWCWGRQFYDQLTWGGWRVAAVPVPVTIEGQPTSGFTKVAAGDQDCALTAQGGQAFCINFGRLDSGGAPFGFIDGPVPGGRRYLTIASQATSQAPVCAGAAAPGECAAGCSGLWLANASAPAHKLQARCGTYKLIPRRSMC